MTQDALFLKRLERPQGVVDVVLDTDTYNEAIQLLEKYRSGIHIKQKERLSFSEFAKWFS